MRNSPYTTKMEEDRIIVTIDGPHGGFDVSIKREDVGIVVDVWPHNPELVWSDGEPTATITAWDDDLAEEESDA